MSLLGLIFYRWNISKKQFLGIYLNGLFDNKIDVKNFKISHFTIFTLFVYVFIRAGWSKIESKKNE